LATYDVKDVCELFTLANRCTRAAKGRAWHSQPTPEAGKASKPEADAAAQSSGKHKDRKKKSNNNKLLASAPTTTVVAAAVGGGHGPHDDKRLRQLSGSDEGGPRCLMHNSRHHNTKECQEIKKFMEQLHEQQK
jgi:hypothetical protein